MYSLLHIPTGTLLYRQRVTSKRTCLFYSTDEARLFLRRFLFLTKVYNHNLIDLSGPLISKYAMGYRKYKKYKKASDTLEQGYRIHSGINSGIRSRRNRITFYGDIVPLAGDLEISINWVDRVILNKSEFLIVRV